MDADRLASQSPWWTDPEAIKRDAKVKRVLETGERIVFALKKENQVLIGPRQLGKTTALKYDIYEKISKQGVDPHSILYYSFDTARNFEEISEVLGAFASGEGKKFAYLDEVSFVSGWQRAVKQFLDSDMAANTTLYITGSSSINLRKELMPGRKIRFMEFLPLSFRDFLISFGSEGLKQLLEKGSAESFEEAVRLANNYVSHFDEIRKWFGIYVKTGGYPDVIFDYLGNGSVSGNLYDIHWNAFVSDVSKDGKSVEIATAVIYGIVESYSSKINLSGIARMQGIKSHVTVRDYIESFEDLFVSRSIFPIDGKKYAFRKERKIYFGDPFLYNMFAEKTNIVDKQKESKIVEGILHSHLYRFVNRDKGVAEPKTAIGFYSGKKEVDFVTGDFGFELKWQDSVTPSDFPDVGLKNKVLLSKKTLGPRADKGPAILPLPLFLSAL